MNGAHGTPRTSSAALRKVQCRSQVRVAEFWGYSGVGKEFLGQSHWIGRDGKCDQEEFRGCLRAAEGTSSESGFRCHRSGDDRSGEYNVETEFGDGRMRDKLDMPSRAFFAQTTSLEFLAKHKFDFNTCVYDGISYLSRDQEAAARSQLGLGPRLDVRKQNIAEEHEIPLTRSGDVLFAEKIRVEVGEWRDESGLPVIGHNCILDMIHLHNSEHRIHKGAEVAEDFRRYGGTKDTDLKHEAGFDAYMTGAVFAQACHLLQIDVATIRNLPQAVKQGDAGLASYVNLLALGWVGNMALDLSSGKQATGVKAFHAHQLPANYHSDNSTVALVWGFPVGSQEQDLLKVVQKMFKPERHGLRLEITLVDNSAFIEFRNPAVMQQFFQILQVPKTAHKSISSDLRAAPFEAYEYLCKPPLSTELLADSAHILGLDQRFVEGCAMHHDTCSEMLPFPRSEEHFDPEMMPPVISQENSDTRHDPGFGKGQEIGSDFSESFDFSEGARDQLREEMLEIPEVDNSLVLENFEGTFSVDRSLQLSSSKNLDTRQQFSPGNGIDNAIEKKDVSSVELKISSLMKRSFSEKQPLFSRPKLIKLS
ncbi:unnamed protein product [Sphagnum troendelagicum]|uniref:Uncharacterized protein n=1 Tax=Sphagnum troendelagicum TaxID=128251 RepID=A0ABP0THU8_9BRYO